MGFTILQFKTGDRDTQDLNDPPSREQSRRESGAQENNVRETNYARCEILMRVW